MRLDSFNGQVGHQSAALRTVTSTLTVPTTKAPQFIDITEDVRELVRQSGLRNGLVVIFSRHTTAAIKLNENEPLLLQDMEQFLERVSPRLAEYKHNDFTIRTVNITEDECPNGHAHCQHLVMSSSETVPLVEGELVLGKWQSVFLVELDHPRTREVLVHVLGG